MQVPGISIIVPVYKVEPYLNKCVDSILSQTFTDFELILVDDGSPDNCGAICDAYAAKDDRVRVIHKENGGLSDARNAGIDAARGEFLGFVDSDDYILPEMYEQLYGACMEYGVRMAGCDALWIYDDTDAVDTGSDGTTSLLTADEFFLRMIDVRRFMDVTAWNKLYHRDLFEGVRYPVGKIYEDQGTTYKLVFQNEKLAYVSKPLYAYRKRRAGAISTYVYGDGEYQRLEMNGEMTDYVRQNHPAVARAALVYRMITCHLSIVNAMIHSGVKDRKMIAMLRGDIRKNAGEILRADIACSKKLQLMAAGMGFGFYRMLYRLLKK